jgi:hypothetical protein
MLSMLACHFDHRDGIEDDPADLGLAGGALGQLSQ